MRGGGVVGVGNRKERVGEGGGATVERRRAASGRGFPSWRVSTKSLKKRDGAVE